MNELRTALIADKIGNYVHDLQDEYPTPEIAAALAWVVAHWCKHSENPKVTFTMFVETSSEMLEKL